MEPSARCSVCTVHAAAARHRMSVAAQTVSVAVLAQLLVYVTLPSWPPGDNEVWNLAKDPQHYNGIVRVMNLREDLRSYVTAINLETANTGTPMAHPMFMAFENDPVCQTPDVEGQYVLIIMIIMKMYFS